MCLILFAWRVHPRFPLVVAANRDEYHARVTAPVALWDDAPGVLAGRDLQAGGTWLGVDRRGRFAAITNVRDPARVVADAPSRGELVADFLTGDEPAPDYAHRVAGTGERYNGFNLVVGDGVSLWWLCNRGGPPAPVRPGVHGISNGLLDEPWPKVISGRAAVRELLERDGPDPVALMEILADREAPPDDHLPDTGVGMARERDLSPRFILGADYGTRSSTALSLTADGALRLLERAYDPAGRVTDERAVELTIPRL
jgi:uncharacterized protein with NRDE domain